MFGSAAGVAVERQPGIAETSLPTHETAGIVVVDHRVKDPVAAARDELIPGVRAVILNNPASEITFDAAALSDARFHFTLSAGLNPVMDSLSDFVSTDAGLSSCLDSRSRANLLVHASGVIEMLMKVSEMDPGEANLKVQLLIKPPSPNLEPELKRHNAGPEGHITAIHSFSGGPLCIAPDPGLISGAATGNIAFEVPGSCTSFLTNGRLIGCLHSFVPGDEPAVIFKATQETRTPETAGRLELEMRMLKR